MKARITVIKKTFHKDVVDQYLPDYSDRAQICPVFEEGQIFAVEGPFPSKTEGFCNWAWTDIHKTVALTMMGANPTLRPVTFRIQRIEA